MDDREEREEQRKEGKKVERIETGRKKVSKIDRDREQIKARNKVIKYIMLLKRGTTLLPDALKLKKKKNSLYFIKYICNL